MFWVPQSFSEWMSLFWKMLTDPAPPVVVAEKIKRPRCIHCGK